MSLTRSSTHTLLHVREQPPRVFGPEVVVVEEALDAIAEELTHLPRRGLRPRRPRIHTHWLTPARQTPSTAGRVLRRWPEPPLRLLGGPRPACHRDLPRRTAP